MRHAYLIIAHNNFNQLKTLLNLLDDERNDIYLHIGKDVRAVDFQQFNCVKSCLYFSNERFVTSWGSENLVIVTLNMLKQAINTSEYSYFHLLSGLDLPIKTQDCIHSFFEKNSGKNYVGFDLKTLSDKKSHCDMISRVKYYHWFVDFHRFRKSNNLLIRKISSGISFFLDKTSVAIQRIFRVNRLKTFGLDVYKGDEWFSITKDFAEYLVSKEDLIRKFVKRTFCSDEIFVQTIIMNSPFKVTLPDGLNTKCMRYIDWERGSPYIFEIEDLSDIIQSECLFARKFNEKIDAGVIEEIVCMLRCCPIIKKRSLFSGKNDLIFS